MKPVKSLSLAGSLTAQGMQQARFFRQNDCATRALNDGVPSSHGGPYEETIPVLLR
jgi:hypothetical protein